MDTSSPIIFFGTPDFAVPALRRLANKYNVVAVVTQPDRPFGRKKILTPSPVKKAALELGIPVLQPETLSQKKEAGIQAVAQIEAFHPEMIVLAAYGNILPARIIDMPKYGCINIHPSLLPSFRGATPMQEAILKQSRETGVTIMKMDTGMDTGPILMQEAAVIAPDITYPALHELFSEKGAELLLQVVEKVCSLPENEALLFLQGTKQNDSLATFCSKITREDGFVTAETTPEIIDAKLRAYTPWPGIYTMTPDGKRIKILNASFDAEKKKLTLERIQIEGDVPRTYTEFTQKFPDIQLPW